MQNFFRCTNCRSEIDEYEYKPMVVGCPHMICLTCVRKQNPQSKEIHCKDCNKAVEVDRLNLPVNQQQLTLFNLIRKLQEQDRKHYICEAHNDKSIDFVCKKDK